MRAKCNCQVLGSASHPVWVPTDTLGPDTPRDRHQVRLGRRGNQTGSRISPPPPQARPPPSPLPPPKGRRWRGRDLPRAQGPPEWPLSQAEQQAPASAPRALASGLPGLRSSRMFVNTQSRAPSRNRPVFSVTVASGISLSTGNNPWGIVFLNPGMKPPR